MNIEELIKLAESLDLQPVNETQLTRIDGQSLNTCINILYALMDLAYQDEDDNGEQILKAALLWVEDYRKEYIAQLTDEEGNI